MTDPTPLQACAALALLYLPTCGRSLESEEDREALVGAVTLLAGGDRHGASQALDEAHGILQAQIGEVEDPADLFNGLGQVLQASDASLAGEVFSTLVTSLGPPDAAADHAIATFSLVANALGQTAAAAEVLMGLLQLGEEGDSESRLDGEPSESRSAAADVRDGAQGGRVRWCDLPSAETYTRLTEKLRSGDRVPEFWFLADTARDDRFLPIFGFIGGRVPLVRTNSDGSESKNFSRAFLASLTDDQLLGLAPLPEGHQAVSGRERGFCSVLSLGAMHLNSAMFHHGEAVPVDVPDWLVPLALYSQENERYGVEVSPTVSSSYRKFSWFHPPLEYLDPDPYVRQLKSSDGSRRGVLLGFMRRGDIDQQFFPSEDGGHSDLVHPLLVLDEDGSGQAIAMAEYFAESYRSLQQTAVVPFYGSTFALTFVAEATFYSFLDWCRVDPDQLPPSAGTRGNPEQIEAGVEEFTEILATGCPGCAPEGSMGGGGPLNAPQPAAVAPKPSAPKAPTAQAAAPRSNEALVQTLRQSSLTFTEMGPVAATRLEFGESGRQQVVCVVTDPQVAAFAEYGRVGVYSVIGCDTESDDLHRVMAAVETAAPLGGFRLSEGQLVFHAEVPAAPAVEELERVVVACGRIADACESMLTGDEDAF